VPAHVRREPRYPIALPAIVSVGGRVLEGVTADVSFEGAFIEASSSALAIVYTGPARLALEVLSSMRLGELVRLTLLVPGAAERLDVAAVAVHIERRTRRVGVGLRFYALAGDAKVAWDRFVGRMRDELPTVNGRAVAAARGEHFEPMLYRSAHHVAVLRAYVRGVSELYELTAPGVDRMFLLTDEPLGVGAELGLQMAHPDSNDIFELSAFVTRAVDQHGVRGVEIEFLDLDEARRARLKEFVDDGLEAIFDEESLADEPAPTPRT
jgi:hypothetical protein